MWILLKGIGFTIITTGVVVYLNRRREEIRYGNCTKKERRR